MKAIVNVNERWAIGYGGELLCFIKEDMRFFRETTRGKLVIMGRKNLESFPGGRPLKGRVNVVLTRRLSSVSEEARAAADLCLPLPAEEPPEGDAFRAAAQAVRAFMEVPEAERPTLLIIAGSREQVLRLAAPWEEESYVIGGAEIYRQFLPDCSLCLVTKNNVSKEADVYFPDLDADPAWDVQEMSEEHRDGDVSYRFYTYVRKDTYER